MKYGVIYTGKSASSDCFCFGQVENADFSDIADIADFISPTFINPCFRYSPIANIENLDLKNPRFSIFTRQMSENPRFSNILLFDIHYR